MFTYQVDTVESAPGKSKPALEQLERVFGFVPNIAGAMRIRQCWQTLCVGTVSKCSRWELHGG